MLFFKKTADCFFKLTFFLKIWEYQIRIRPDKIAVLIWVQTVSKGSQAGNKSPLAGKELIMASSSQELPINSALI